MSFKKCCQAENPQASIPPPLSPPPLPPLFPSSILSSIFAPPILPLSDPSPTCSIWGSSNNLQDGAHLSCSSTYTPLLLDPRTPSWPLTFCPVGGGSDGRRRMKRPQHHWMVGVSAKKKKAEEEEALLLVAPVGCRHFNAGICCMSLAHF